MNATVRENGRMRWPIAWGFPHHALRTYLLQLDQKVLLGALSARIRQLSHGSWKCSLLQNQNCARAFLEKR